MADSMGARTLYAAMSAAGGKNFIETVWGRGYVLREGAPQDEDMRETA